MDNKTNKPPFQKKKAKARQATIIDEETSDEEGTDYGDPEINIWVYKGQSLKVEYKDVTIQQIVARLGLSHSGVEFLA